MAALIAGGFADEDNRRVAIKVGAQPFASEFRTRSRNVERIGVSPWIENVRRFELPQQREDLIHVRKESTKHA